MTPMKLTAGGVTALLAISGAVTIGHSLVTHPLSSPWSSSSGSTRPVADDLTARNVYNGAKNSVAYIGASTAEGQATGSGFVVSGDGLVVTNHHVIEGAQDVTVKIGTNGKQRPAQIVADDPSHDLALLKVDTGGASLPTLSLGDSSKVDVGDATYAIGNPFGLDHTFTTGVVSALHRDLQAPNGATITGGIQTDAAINPGNSGGPLLDSAGKVIGVNAQIATGSQTGEGANVGIGFAIPSSTVKQFLSDAKAGKDAPAAADAARPDAAAAGPDAAADRPVRRRPGGSAAGGPVAGRPAAGGPVAGRPVAGRPAAGGPVAGGPVAGGPAQVDPNGGQTDPFGDQQQAAPQQQADPFGGIAG